MKNDFNLAGDSFIGEMRRTADRVTGGLGDAEQRVVEASGGLQEALKKGVAVKGSTTVTLPEHFVAPAQRVLDAAAEELKRDHPLLEAVVKRDKRIEMRFTQYHVVRPKPRAFPPVLQG